MTLIIVSLVYFEKNIIWLPVLLSILLLAVLAASVASLYYDSKTSERNSVI